MNKSSGFFFVLILLASCSVRQSTRQPAFRAYQIVPDTHAKILEGLLRRSDIDHDTAFKWFQQNYALGQADQAAVSVFQKDSAKFQMVVFFGTWCEDSQNLLPVFYRLVDKSGYPEKNITLIGVDRKKQAPGNLSQAFHITNVPTFIVMQDGREVGRVVEYGKYGRIDKELGEIVSAIK